jgi:hypothetical protein
MRIILSPAGGRLSRLTWLDNPVLIRARRSPSHEQNQAFHLFRALVIGALTKADLRTILSSIGLVIGQASKLGLQGRK